MRTFLMAVMLVLAASLAIWIAWVTWGLLFTEIRRRWEEGVADESQGQRRRSGSIPPLLWWIIVILALVNLVLQGIIRFREDAPVTGSLLLAFAALVVILIAVTRVIGPLRETTRRRLLTIYLAVAVPLAAATVYLLIGGR